MVYLVRRRASGKYTATFIDVLKTQLKPKLNATLRTDLEKALTGVVRIRFSNFANQFSNSVWDWKNRKPPFQLPWKKAQKNLKNWKVRLFSFSNSLIGILAVPDVDLQSRPTWDDCEESTLPWHHRRAWHHSRRGFRSPYLRHMPEMPLKKQREEGTPIPVPGLRAGGAQGRCRRSQHGLSQQRESRQGGGSPRASQVGRMQVEG